MDLLRVGKVTSINTNNYTVRVEFLDKDSMVSQDLPVLVGSISNVNNPDAVLPKIGETVVCIFLPNGQQGFCLGAFYIQQ